MTSEKKQRHCSVSTLHLFWFSLLDSETGKPYKGATVDAVSLQSDSVVAQFREAVQAKYSKLFSFDASDLLVYKNRSCFDKAIDEGMEKPLDPGGFPRRTGRSQSDKSMLRNQLGKSSE